MQSSANGRCETLGALVDGEVGKIIPAKSPPCEQHNAAFWNFYIISGYIEQGERKLIRHVELVVDGCCAGHGCV